MSRQRAFANQERHEQAQRLARMGRSLLLLVATVLSFATVGLLTADQLYRPDTFAIDQLKITGRFRYLDPVRVEQAVRDVAAGNFFSVNLREIEDRVETLSWVQDAAVRREWPDTLLVRVREQRPVMRWGKDRWVNADGEVIRLPDNAELANAITLSGTPRNASLMLHTAIRWKRQLQNSGLHLHAVSLSGSHAWTLTVFDPEHRQAFQILLGREEPEYRLRRFQYLFADQFRGTRQRLDRVDARYPDGLAIKATQVEAEGDVAMQSTDRPDSPGVAGR